MSSTDQAQRSSTTDTDAGSGVRRHPHLGRRGLVAGVAGIAAVAGVAVAMGLGRSSTGTSGSAAPRTAAHFEAPDGLNGATAVPKAEDITQSKQWKDEAVKVLDGARFFARTYSTSPTSPTARVVVAATDLTGKLEQAWAADGGTAVGDDRCTQNLTLGERVGVRPTVSLCWRTTEELSAYVLVIDPRHPVHLDAAAATLDEAWKRALA